KIPRRLHRSSGHRNRHRRRQTRSRFRSFPTSRQHHFPQIRRHRPRPHHFPHPAHSARRPHPRLQQTRTRQHFQHRAPHRRPANRRLPPQRSPFRRGGLPRLMPVQTARSDNPIRNS